MRPRAKPLLSAEEYLATERQSGTRSEFLDGEMFAMSGASLRHNRLAMNLATTLEEGLRSGDCEVFVSDLRVRVQATGLYTYPDVVVVCGRPEVDDEEMDTLLNPKIIFEILSKPTESYDRGMKFSHYRTLPSLSDYVLVAQERMHVEHYSRQAGDRWLLADLDGREAVLQLPSVGIDLPLASIYRRVLDEDALVVDLGSSRR